MKNITTKYLRENLKEIVSEVNDKGQEYMVYYRSKPAFKVIPEGENTEIQSKKRVQERIKFFRSIKGKPIGTRINHPDEDKEVYRKELMKKHGKGIS